MAGVPLLLWKLLEEIAPGDKRSRSRASPRTVADAALRARRQLAFLAGAFVSEGWVAESRAGFNNTDRDFFDAVVDAL